MTNSPTESALTLRTNDEAADCAETFARGMRWPLESETVPTRFPWVICDEAGRLMHRNEQRATVETANPRQVVADLITRPPQH
jgi:hypothetical protein